MTARTAADLYSKATNPPTVWHQTRSGIAWDMLHPRVKDVNFRDIAEALGKICRFAGHTQTFYSVAQHSMLVADNVSEAARPYALLHDAHEFIIGDWPKPAANAFAVLGGLEAIKAFDALKARTQTVIHIAAGLSQAPSRAISAEIQAADNRALITERNEFMSRPPMRWGVDDKFRPFDRPIRALAWPDAVDRYYAALCDAGIVSELRR